MEHEANITFGLLMKLTDNYVNAKADLAVLKARVSLLYELTMREKTCIFPQEIAHIFGWALPATNNEEDE